MPEITVSTIMKTDPTGSDLVKFAKVKAELWKDDLKRSQIRNIFTEAREIEAQWDKDSVRAMRRLNLLKAKLAYQQARHKTDSMKGFVDTLTKAIEEVENASEDERADRFQRFMDLFEAILAYHRAFGGS